MWGLEPAGEHKSSNLQVKFAFRLNTRLGPEIAIMSKMNKKEQVCSLHDRHSCCTL